MNLANSTMKKKKKKNSVPIVDFCESSWTFVKFLLLLFPLLQGRQCLFKIRSVSNGGYDIHPQEHPFVYKHLRLEHFQSFDYGMFHLV